MNGFLTFWAILATRQFCGNGKQKMSKKSTLVSAQCCPGQRVPSGTWSATPPKCSSQKSLWNWNHSDSPWKLVQYWHLLEAWLAAKTLKGQIHWKMFQIKRKRQVCASATNHCTGWKFWMYEGATVLCKENETTELHFCLWQGWIRWTYTLKFHTWVGVIPGVHQFLPGAWEDPLLALPPQNNDRGTSQLTNWNAWFSMKTGDLMARSVWNWSDCSPYNIKNI